MDIAEHSGLVCFLATSSCSAILVKSRTYFRKSIPSSGKKDGGLDDVPDHITRAPEKDKVEDSQPHIVSDPKTLYSLLPSKTHRCFAVAAR